MRRVTRDEVKLMTQRLYLLLRLVVTPSIAVLECVHQKSAGYSSGFRGKAAGVSTRVEM